MEEQKSDVPKVAPATEPSAVTIGDKPSVEKKIDAAVRDAAATPKFGRRGVDSASQYMQMERGNGSCASDMSTSQRQLQVNISQEVANECKNCEHLKLKINRIVAQNIRTSREAEASRKNLENLLAKALDTLKASQTEASEFRKHSIKQTKEYVDALKEKTVLEEMKNLISKIK